MKKGRRSVMSRKRKRRGISLGTVVMLVLTLVVAVGLGRMLPRLMGDTVVAIDTGRVLEALTLTDGLPELSLSDIPIAINTRQPQAQPQTTMAPVSGAAATAPVISSAAPAPTATSEPVQGGSFTLTLGGSVCVDEAVRQSGYYSDSRKYDYAEVLSLLSGEMQSDLTLLSLENLVMPEKKVSSLIVPTEVMTMLASAGVDMVALGFPKAVDQGLDGLASTIAAAKSAGMKTLGAYTDQADAGEARMLTLGRVRVAFLHYTEKVSSKGQKALKKADAAFVLPLAEPEAIAADIARVRQAGAQVVVVSLNWGTEGKSAPTKAQTELAQKIADAGADIIMGTGSRVVQPTVWLEGHRADGSAGQTLCAYSLGALINESRKNAGVAAMLLQLKISVDGAGRVTFDEAAYTPTYIWRYRVDGKYYYRAIASDQPNPFGMGEEQAEAKTRAMGTTQKYLGETCPLVLRTK